MNPFSRSYPEDSSDQKLIELAQKGDAQALSQLLERHQPYIYNLAWKMTGDATQAEDLSQEALLKIVNGLGTYNFRSAFRTWAYRIVVNHFLNDKRRSRNMPASSFSELGAALDAVPNVDLTAEERVVERETTREVRLQCLSGMLLCLTREQRMVYIIGEVFAASHHVGSELMGISGANFRMKLSKARKDLSHFMNHKCGLVDPKNPCRCHKKVKVSLEQGIVDAKNLLFNKAGYSSFRAQLEPDANYLVEDSDAKYAELHRGHSYRTDFSKVDFLRQLLDSQAWKDRLDLA